MNHQHVATPAPSKPAKKKLRVSGVHGAYRPSLIAAFLKKCANVGPLLRQGLLPQILLVATMLPGLSAVAQSPDNPLGLKAHHITAAVMDLERSISWYRDTLGFSLTERGSHGPIQFAVLSIPGFDVALIKTAELEVSAPTVHGTAPSWIHIVFSVPDPDRVFKLLKSRGANPSTRDGSIAGPIKSFLIKDSEGNEIEIVEDANRIGK